MGVLYAKVGGAWEEIIGSSAAVTGIKLSDLAQLSDVAANDLDLIEVVDISDTSMAASGTNKQMTLIDLASWLGLHLPFLPAAIVTSSAISNGTIQTIDIGNSQVTNAKLDSMLSNTIKGNNAAFGPPLDLTVAQVVAMLSAVQTTRTISTTAPLSGGGDLSANRTLTVSAATESAAGVVELATAAETLTGTDNTRAIHPAGAAATFAPLRQLVNAQTGTTYTLVASDEGKLVTLNNASAITLTVSSAAAFPVGARIDLAQLGAGKVTVVGSGVTVNGTPSLGFRAQYSAASLVCYATNTFLLAGDLA